MPDTETGQCQNVAGETYGGTGGGLCPCCIPTKRKEAVLLLFWEGKEGEHGCAEGGSLPKLADHAKVLTLHPPPGRHPYPEGRHKAS